ncbi:hypothetical protein Athai_09260 [Actinocatenispora thailandica]|uniref:Glycosyltransferase GT-D fold domain-containing protein n=1 Tax=Actinocatenispora thailandica TaxID=227318 RepID=A0A7R7HV71_9ACTN|nr:GT-D fold domain-containing glycosyltransferase [Actinocatenispora thailandica]BCJ33423.1 hypothetical protein Athai_09260 [Actinocatenispora thailandica]
MIDKARRALRRIVTPLQGIERNTARLPKAIADQHARDRKVLQKILTELQEQRQYLEIFRLAMTGPILDDVESVVEPRQLGFLETLAEIRKNRLSFARFGDGELRMMLRPDYTLRFQRNSPELRQALRALLTEPRYRDEPNLLLGLPFPYGVRHWSGVWADIWPQLRPLVADLDRFGTTHVSRPVFFSYTRDAGVAAWRSVWADRRICVITGENSRFTLLPALFDNVADATFLHSTPRDAFDDVPRLVAEAMDHDAELFLIALGPAGSVLAAELALRGRWALDVGHISDSYQVEYEDGDWPERKAIVSASPQ